MQVRFQPYPNLLIENFMENENFIKLNQSINFDEIKKYCDNPQSPEHDNAQHGNYSMPCDYTQNAQWVFDYFAKPENFDNITFALYGARMEPDHWYVNFHYDKQDTSLGVHNDQKKYRWLVTGQLYVSGHDEDGVILQDKNLDEIVKIPLQSNMFYAIATSMYSWHHVKNIQQDKVSVLFRFGKKQINTVTNFDLSQSYGIVIVNDGHYDGHYSKLGMRMANITEAWLATKGYKNIHISEWRNPATVDKLVAYCKQKYGTAVLIPSGYLGKQLEDDFDIMHDNIQPVKINADNHVQITKENILEFADIVFLKKQSNRLFAQGESVLRTYDNLSNFSDCDIL